MNALVEKILPARRVHLLAGVSDAGKTRFIIPAMLNWQAGKPFLGYESHPAPWAYVAGDRTMEEAQDTIGSMGIDPADVPMIPAFGKDDKAINKIMLTAVAMNPRPQLLVIEGFSDLVGGHDTRRDVRAFLSNVSAYCNNSVEFPDGLTVLGIVETPKMKPAEQYANPRQRVSGVSSWGFHTSTVMLIEYLKADKDCESQERMIWACMKNSIRRKFAAQFDENGRLQYLP